MKTLFFAVLALFSSSTFAGDFCVANVDSEFGVSARTI
jgi:hypothetical protein